MPGQIVNVSNDQAISEVALKCGDPFFKDFPRNIYSQSVYRATREIAKEYGIMDRTWSYTNTDGTSPVEVAPLNFNGPWRVAVTPSDGDEQVYTEVKIDDILFAQRLLHPPGEDRLFEFSREGAFRGQQQLLGDLLGDGAAALGNPAGLDVF